MIFIEIPLDNRIKEIYLVKKYIHFFIRYIMNLKNNIIHILSLLGYTYMY